MLLSHQSFAKAEKKTVGNSYIIELTIIYFEKTLVSHFILITILSDTGKVILVHFEHGHSSILQCVIYICKFILLFWISGRAGAILPLSNTVL